VDTRKAILRLHRASLSPAFTTTNYNANNQQLTFGTTTETFDLNGNLATSTDAGVTTTYTWNARNQLTGISKTGFTSSFTYDSFGRRTGRTVNGTVTNYVYDGLNPVQEKNGVTVTANLLTGLGIDEFFTRTDGVGVRALLPDALDSTIALGDGTGTLQTQYTYEPFGFVSQTGAASTSSYQYTGREDDGTGLMYYRARYYQPRLQRFISEDPMEFLGNDINMYVYVGNSPVRFFDPLGWIRWNKNPPDTVPVTGQTLTNLQCVEKCLQQQTNNPSLDLLMTGGAEATGHTPGSHHPRGEACDIAGPAFNPVTGNQVLGCASRCGFGAGHFEDYPGVNRDHWHIQIYPGNGVPALPPPATSSPIQPGQTP
jgi:RHS repeat-associated protein